MERESFNHPTSEAVQPSANDRYPEKVAPMINESSKKEALKRIKTLEAEIKNLSKDKETYEYMSRWQNLAKEDIPKNIEETLQKDLAELAVLEKVTQEKTAATNPLKKFLHFFHF